MAEEFSQYEIGMLFTVSDLREHAAHLDHKLRVHMKQHTPEATYTHAQTIDLDGQPYIVITTVEPMAAYHRRVSEKTKIQEIRDSIICDRTTGAGDYDEAVEYADRIIGK